ncbi:hypothetical protein AB4587_05150 [Vibrio breoganii]
MRYIQLRQIKPDLPLRWEQVVQNARNKVAEKMWEARNKASKQGKSLSDIHQSMMVARKNAINSRSRIWRMLNKQLAKVSFGKCWYCQSMDIRSPKPVDHFRPKSSVKECSEHSGYWWLAFSWENFRYSCTYCNSAHENERKGGGKQDHFPLSNPQDRQYKPGQKDRREQPILLDPCQLGDSKLITYDVRRALVIPNKVQCQLPQNHDGLERAKQSIDIYDFNHEPLRRKRETIFDDINQIIIDINEYIESGFDKNYQRIQRKQEELIDRIRFDSLKYDYNEAAYCYLKAQIHKNPWIETVLEEAR